MLSDIATCKKRCFPFCEENNIVLHVLLASSISSFSFWDSVLSSHYIVVNSVTVFACPTIYLFS